MDRMDGQLNGAEGGVQRLNQNTHSPPYFIFIRCQREEPTNENRGALYGLDLD
ncbi:hypothetical protein RvY_05823 [Ramazzottius varieornatus]|uniref:Uncharacterized protein n=1 Tax=Ramazzottius varieornatus TaxID=947166 RepID=A0A1D1V5C0_RAMVA|nr:hypothetical protein RvY_05823 [Ramazzottius varieornatus]